MIYSTSRARFGTETEQKRKTKIRSTLWSTVKFLVALLLGASFAFGYYQYAGSNSSTTNLTGSQSVVTETTTSVVSTTVTTSDAREINSLQNEISQLQNQINQLQTQVTTLQPVQLYGKVNVTGWGNGPASRIDFEANGITYSVTVKNGAYQIFLPRGNIYQVLVQYPGWLGWGQNKAPTQPVLDLTQTKAQLIVQSYTVTNWP